MVSFISMIFLSSLNTPVLDLILGACLLIGLINGFRKGFIRSLTSLIALLVGAYAALFFSEKSMDFLSRFFNIHSNLLGIAAIIFIFFIVFTGTLILGRLLSKIADFAALGLLNKLAGGFFGLLKWSLILSLALNLLVIFEDEDEKIIPAEVVQDSYLFEPIENLGKKIWPILKENLDEKFT